MRLTRLLDDLLDLSVLEAGQIVLNQDSGTLGALLDRCVAVSGVDVMGLTIKRDPQAEDLVVNTDLDRLGQVFINLISNARKYCDAQDPVLSIKVGRDGDDLVIDFTDNGSGIATDEQSVIFEKFARVGQNKAGGAGLGLPICREIMMRLGGSVSYLPGQRGASFRVKLPMQVKIAAQ